VPASAAGDGVARRAPTGIAFEELKSVEVQPDGADGTANLSREGMGSSDTIPFKEYRRSRPQDSGDMFEDRAEQCSYIVALDGIYDTRTRMGGCPSDATRRATHAQAAVLLRHSDILIAATDPSKSRTIGDDGTAADGAGFELPVVFIDTQSGEVWGSASGRTLVAGHQPAAANGAARRKMTSRFKESWQTRTLRITIRS